MKGYSIQRLPFFCSANALMDWIFIYLKYLQCLMSSCINFKKLVSRFFCKVLHVLKGLNLQTYLTRRFQNERHVGKYREISVTESIVIDALPHSYIYDPFILQYGQKPSTHTNLDITSDVHHRTQKQTKQNVLGKTNLYCIKGYLITFRIFGSISDRKKKKRK